ncbi:hypothetical protein EO763_19900 [Pectobacterium odoriferum]|nr:hypothetical protein EO763_19900 [Pectobacterium odoriferum]ULS44327.1 hypothetical protein F9W95_01280 [Pectobacterium carotovorum]
MGSTTKPRQLCKKAYVSCVISRVFLCAISTTPDSGRSVAAALRTQAFWRKFCRYAVPSAFVVAVRAVSDAFPTRH